MLVLITDVNTSAEGQRSSDESPAANKGQRVQYSVLNEPEPAQWSNRRKNLLFDPQDS